MRAKVQFLPRDSLQVILFPAQSMQTGLFQPVQIHTLRHRQRRTWGSPAEGLPCLRHLHETHTTGPHLMLPATALTFAMQC